jgi:hypothetical protein
MRPKSKTDVFIYLVVVTGLPFGLGMAAVLQESAAEWVPIGIVFGLVMAAFGTPKLVGVTRTIPYQDKQSFVDHLNVRCAEIGYRVKSQVGDFLSYEATGDSSFTIGPIKIAPASYLGIAAQIGTGQATLVGPNKAVSDIEAGLLRRP